MMVAAARSRRYDVENPGTVVAVMAISCVGISVLLLAPAIVGQFIGEYAFSPRQAAYLVSAEMAGIAFASLPAMFWLNRVDWRIVLGLAFCASAFFLFLSAFCSSFAWLAWTRFLGGLSSGTAVAVGLATCGLRRHTERVFGLCVMAQLIFGALALALFPCVVAIWGIRGVYLALATVTLLCLIIVPCVPSSSGPRTSVSVAEGEFHGIEAAVKFRRVLYGSLAIFGLYLFYVSISGVWTFLGAIIGTDSALSGAEVDHMLSVATLMGIAGAATAATVSTRWGLKVPPALGITLILSAFVLFNGKVSAVACLLAACMFKFAWTFALPYFLGAIAGSDRQGRMVVIGNIFVGGGLASGPVIAAQLVSSQGYGRLLLWASLAMLMSFLVVLPVLLSRRRPVDGPNAIQIAG